MAAILSLASLLPIVFAAQAPTFAPPAGSPAATSTNYTGSSNGTITNGPLVPGAVFDRFIQIWIENTDFATVNSSTYYQNLATQGILLTNYMAVTHPSEPNYAAVVGGDFWGMPADGWFHIPNNISTIVDLLDEKAVSWSSYQENMPYDGYQGFNYSSPNYLNSSAGDYVYYVRKHNPLILYDSVALNETRAFRVRNFNDFAMDLNNNSISQWTFITPNLVNDAHDTTIDFSADWLEYWLTPLLTNPNFNNDRTLIFLTFDETETYTIQNQVWSLLLGGVVPANLKGTVDTTFYTHYSCLSSVEANWGLGSLGRGDVNKTLSNVFDFMLAGGAINYSNVEVATADQPLLNLTANIPGPLNAAYYVPFLAPANLNATGAGGGPVFTASNLNLSLTPSDAPAPVNLTALGEAVPDSYPTVSTTSPTATSTTSASVSTSSAAGSFGNVAGLAAVALGALAGFALLL